MTQSLMSIGWMLLALVLAASIGLERQIRGKSAGIRTQAIVGLTACLMMLISKYGFSDTSSTASPATTHRASPRRSCLALASWARASSSPGTARSEA